MKNTAQILCLILALGLGSTAFAGSAYNWNGTIVQTWEGESGTLTAPMSSNTSGGVTYIRCDPHNDTGGNPPGGCGTHGCATYSFTPCVSGAYKLEMNMRADGGSEDSLYVGITGVNDTYPGGGSVEKRWDVDDSGGTSWNWRFVTDYVNTNDEDNARVWILTGGTTYTIVIKGRENDTRVDQLRMRRDPALTCPPAGTLTRTPTITVTPTPYPTANCAYQAESGAEQANITEGVNAGRTYIYNSGADVTTCCAQTYKDILINAPADGTYEVWAWIYAPTNVDDRWYTELRNFDGTIPLSDNNGFYYDTWEFDPATYSAGYAQWFDSPITGFQGGGAPVGPRRWNLPSGNYVLRIYRGLANAWIDCLSTMVNVGPYFTPTPTLQYTPTPIPTVWQGLAPSERLYGFEYIPLPVNSSGGTNFYDLAMTFTSAASNSVPKNTSRYRIVLDGSIVNVGTQIQVETRVGPHGVTCTTGFLMAVTGTALARPVRPANLSTTYFWLNSGVVPVTERYSTMGDPRYTPYKDMLGLPTGQQFADNYNWFFKDLEDTLHLDYDAAYVPWLPNADWHTYNEPNSDVPKQFRIWREAIVRSRSVYTSMTGYNSYYIGVGGEIGGDSANELNGGVPMNSQPWGAGGTLDRNEITGAASLIRNTANTWRSLPWMGELWPDSAYVTDWASPEGRMGVGAANNSWGNLRNSGGGGGSWRRDSWANCDAAPFTFIDVRHRTSGIGSGTFLNGNGGSGRFDHYFETLNANIGTDGSATSLSYRFPVPATFNVNRPWGLNQGTGNPPEWGIAPYPGSRLALDVYSASTQTANAIGFYMRNSVTNATDRSSAAVRALDTATAVTSPDTALGWFIINGLQPSTDSGINFVAEFAMLTCLRTFHDAGAPTIFGGSYTNLDNKIGANTYRIDPVPMVEILQPNLKTETRYLSNIDIIWNERYTRWDRKAYSENYPCLDKLGNPALKDLDEQGDEYGDGARQRATNAYCTDSDLNVPPNPNLEWHGSEALGFNLKYSDDNGATWRTATTPSITCTAGVYLPDSPHALTYPGSQHAFTWNWDVSALPVGSKKFRVEVYRQNLKQHYAYHEMPIFTNP